MKLDTVGPPLPGVEVRVSPSGEVLYRSPDVFQGYYKNEEATRETIVDGWLHTGDIGELDANGFLTITDRKKDLIKTSGGKYVAPSYIEGLFKSICPYVSQVIVIGQAREVDRRHLGATSVKAPLHLVPLIPGDEPETA